MMKDEQKNRHESPFKEVLSRMNQAARGRGLGDEFVLEPWDASSTVEPSGLWVKTRTLPDGLEGLELSSTKPFDPSGAVALIRPRGEQWQGGVNSRALVRAILQSRLVSWYLHDAQETIALARLPWPVAGGELADQLRFLMMHRDRLQHMGRSLSQVDASVERVIVELYELEADHLMTLDLLPTPSQNSRR